MCKGEWEITFGECPDCGGPAEFGTREVSWVMYVPSWMGDEEYETATRTEHYGRCLDEDCGWLDFEPACY